MSTLTSMRVSTSVRTRTAVHLTDAITGAFSFIVSYLGLEISYLHDDWKALELGLMIWIDEGTLKQVCLEFGDPAEPIAIFDIPLQYRFTGTANEEYVANRTRLARLAAKIQKIPAGTPYRVVVMHNGPHADVVGWGQTTLADRSGLASHNLGTLGAGPNACASLRYLSRRS
jgi:hypothetical protein